jgi:hypothetical protein
MIVTGIGSEAMTSWATYLRQLLADTIDYSDVQIGGEGIKVEVDETKLGKRKYHRGHRVEGVWVIGGVERTSGKKFFFCGSRRSKLLNNQANFPNLHQTRIDYSY